MPTKSASPAKTANTPTAQTKKRASSGRPARRSMPDHCQIAERAYFIHLAEGSSDEIANWLRAERELTTA